MTDIPLEVYDRDTDALRSDLDEEKRARQGLMQRVVTLQEENDRLREVLGLSRAVAGISHGRLSDERRKRFKRSIRKFARDAVE